jgi:hypothetical protein
MRAWSYLDPKESDASRQRGGSFYQREWAYSSDKDDHNSPERVQAWLLTEFPIIRANYGIMFLPGALTRARLSASQLDERACLLR